MQSARRLGRWLSTAAYAPQLPINCNPWKAKALKAAVAQGLLSEGKPLAMFWNLTEINRALEEVKTAFPPNALHTVAAKANQLLSILKVAKQAGAGCECASLGELQQALNAGFAPDKIMFDSPVKTRDELSYGLKRGVNINVDNFQELRVLDGLYGIHIRTRGTRASKYIGIRINPEVGAGSIDTHSTSVPWSKFGIGIKQYRKELLDAYKARPWLNMVHVHAGSQGMPLETIADAIQITIAFAEEVNARAGFKQIEILDIGGGLPVNFDTEEYTPRIADFATILKNKAPQLFTGELPFVTEYGRWYLAKSGFIASRVEYTKEAGGRHIALQHAGADLCVRTVYHPTQWPLRITVFDFNGNMVQADPSQLLTYDIGGPCCIAGDVIARMRPLPRIMPGHYVAIHDTGAYYHSSWSFYNSRAPPALYGYTESEPITFTRLRAPQTVEDTIAFYS
eukprot:m.237256 g.237256  ORF g.237256 m.237256 type:complete len:453 (-) comp13110_c0_seq1:115-1473(-)